MNICVLDGYTLNPGDLSWDALKSLGDCTIYDRTPYEQVVERAKDADILLVNKISLRAELLDKLPKLKYVGELATGYNNIDIEAAAKRGIPVTNIPSYSTMSVAQMVFAHLLNITHHVAEYSADVKRGEWSECKDFCFFNTPIIELAGKTMGLVGLGHTGMATARIALAMGMKVIAKTSKTKEMLPDGIEPVGYDRLFAEADVLSLNCPLCDSTRGIVNKDSLAKMKPTAIIINTGRGPLVVESDLAEALNSGKIAAFGTDVLSSEPPKADNPLLSARNCFITPHIAWATLEARTRLMQIAVENVRQFISGEPLQNRIN